MARDGGRRGRAPNVSPAERWTALGAAWWISPVGESIPVVEHQQALRADPARFGLAFVPWGRAEALTLAMRGGWTRVRLTHREPRITYETWAVTGAWLALVRRHIEETARPGPLTPLRLGEVPTGRVVETTCAAWLVTEVTWDGAGSTASGR